MDFVFDSEYKSLFKKNIEAVIEDFEEGRAAKIFEDSGETYIASKIRERNWKGSEEDKEFIVSIMKLIGLYKELSVIFNNGINEEANEFYAKDGFQKEGEIFLENKNPNNFELILKNTYVTSNYLNLKEITYEKTPHDIRIKIPFEINLSKNFDKDLICRIILVTNYKTYIYKVSVICRKGGVFSAEHKFKNIDEFFSLYLENYSSAIKCFGDERFLNWLNDSGYKIEAETYRRFKPNHSIEQSLQNFLQSLGYDVIPILSYRFIEDTLTIRNIGKGILYGKLYCLGSIEADKEEWAQDDINFEINVICRGKGTIEIVSNGGCASITVDASQNVLSRCETYYKELYFKALFKNKIVMKGLYDIPKICSDNTFVKYYVDDGDIIIERNISIFQMIKNKILNKIITTNVKIIYPERIYSLKICIG